MKGTSRNRCRDCLYEGRCATAANQDHCEYLAPVNGAARCDKLVAELAKSALPAGRNELPAGRTGAWLHNDKQTTLYDYYRRMLNDALRDVRRGGTAHLYSESQLRDFLRYERRVRVWRRDGVFYLSREEGEA